jgi:hypothetical protein
MEVDLLDRERAQNQVRRMRLGWLERMILNSFFFSAAIYFGTTQVVGHFQSQLNYLDRTSESHQPFLTGVPHGLT